jgi:hypothetical protein
MIKTLRKYGKPVPQSLLDAAANTAEFHIESQGTVPANPSDEYDSSYLSPVSVGGKTLNLDFDTGSADL